MKDNRFRCLVVALMLTAGGTPFADEGEIGFQRPPASIGQWYPPANKHQVWLHTMFRLRREMQAVTEYAALGKRELLTKWLGRLDTDYRKIGDMVPEWKDELESELMAQMRKAGETGDLEGLQRLQGKLAKNSCQSCHREYKAVTALLYRAPDFSHTPVEDSETLEEEPYPRVMSRLSMLVNRIKIASEDGRKATAAESLDDLRRRLEDLSASCEACHKDAAPRERILGEAAQSALKKIGAAIEKGDHRGVGRVLGGFAVETCARCHGIHRLSAAMRKAMLPATP